MVLKGRKDGPQMLEDLETTCCHHMGYIRLIPIYGATSGFWASKSLVNGSYQHVTEFESQCCKMSLEIPGRK